MQSSIEIDVALFECILNSLANQKFIHEMSEPMRSETQEAIDGWWKKGMDLLSPVLARDARRAEFRAKLREVWPQEIPDDETLNRHVDLSIGAGTHNAEYLWWEIIPQELDMFARIGEVVPEDELETLCDRRGMDSFMRSFLRSMLMKIGVMQDSK